MKLDKLPLAGLMIAAILFVAAAARYPGGYDPSRDFVSTLFAPVTPAGALNASRPIAVAAMFVFCGSIALMFWRLSRRAPTRVLSKAFEIGGVGSMVYAFLGVTPINHMLMVSMALVFFLAAKVAAVHLARMRGHGRLAGTGVFCLVLLLASAVMYYGQLGWGLLPLAQKASFVACVAWLVALHRADLGGQPTG